MTVDNDMIWTPNIDIINRIHGFSNEDQLHHKCHITYQVSISMEKNQLKITEYYWAMVHRLWTLAYGHMSKVL